MYLMQTVFLYQNNKRYNKNKTNVLYSLISSLNVQKSCNQLGAENLVHGRGGYGFIVKYILQQIKKAASWENEMIEEMFVS